MKAVLICVYLCESVANVFDDLPSLTVGLLTPKGAENLSVSAPPLAII